MPSPILPPDTGYMGDRRRGASFGRPSNTRTSDGRIGKLYLRRLRLDAGGYDTGGAYWGRGLPLYWATDGDEFEVFLRARDRDDAKDRIRVNHGADIRFRA